MDSLFDRKRGMVEGHGPGRKSTLMETLPLLGATGTYVFETVKTERVYLPPRLMRAIYAKRDSLTAAAKRNRARRAAETRKAAGVIPFQRKAQGPP